MLPLSKKAIFIIFISVVLIIPIAFFFLRNFGSLRQLKNISPKQTTFINQSSCVVLDESFCKKGVEVKYKGQFLGLAFKLPAKAKIYAPFEGRVDTSGVFHLKAQKYGSVSVNFQKQSKLDENTISFSAISASPIQKQTTRKGEEIAAASAQTLDTFGDYNLILLFERFNPKMKLFEQDLALLKQYFNYAK